MNNEILFKNLKNLRKSYNLTQDEVARIAGKDRSLIAKYETGKAVPPLDVIRIFAKLYNVSVDSLCGGSEGTDETLVFSTDNAVKDKAQILYPGLTEVEQAIICRLRLSGEDKINEIYESLGGKL